MVSELRRRHLVLTQGVLHRGHPLVPARLLSQGRLRFRCRRFPESGCDDLEQWLLDHRDTGVFSLP